MKTLYLIGGTMGAGKTATCERLSEILPRNVFLDGDWLWKMRPFQVTDETKAMVMDNIRHLLTNFINCSAYENVVFCWVMHEQAIIDDILSALPVSGVRVLSISLILSETALRARLQNDVDMGLRAPDVIERSIARIGMYTALNTQKIDVSDISAHEAARLISIM